MSNGICVSLGDEIRKLGVDDNTRQQLLELFMEKANLAAYESKPYSVNDFINEVKKELNINDAA